MTEAMRAIRRKLAAGQTVILDGATGTELQRVLAHERVDEAELHPEIERLVGGTDPLSAISRAHREIAHLGRRFSRLVAELTEAGPSGEEVTDLRRTLYALEAILRLHFAREDEIYESVAAPVRHELPAPA
jgi:hypothetical protein